MLMIVDSETTEGSENYTPEKRNQYYKWTVLLIFEISEYYYAWNAILRANVLELFAFVIISSATFVASFIRLYKISNILVV